MLKIGLDEQDAREYQKDVYNTVLLKDVIMRNSIRNVPFLENLVRFLSDMHMGEAEAVAWGCDLTHDYVSINADYRS